ncbi:MAG: hypothetical protein NT062_01980 [Proteobacteria bacterium]|nr:hypothetical protein [Pseudomonadota bacterium]
MSRHRPGEVSVMYVNRDFAIHTEVTPAYHQLEATLLGALARDVHARIERRDAESSFLQGQWLTSSCEAARARQIDYVVYLDVSWQAGGAISCKLGHHLGHSGTTKQGAGCDAYNEDTPTAGVTATLTVINPERCAALTYLNQRWVDQSYDSRDWETHVTPLINQATSWMTLHLPSFFADRQ